LPRLSSTVLGYSIKKILRSNSFSLSLFNLLAKAQREKEVKEGSLISGL
jgi:hypothetical protein